MEVKVAEQGLLPFLNAGVQSTADQKNYSKNFKQIYAEIFKIDPSKLAMQNAVELKLMEKESGAKVKVEKDLVKDKDKEKKQTVGDPSLMLASMMMTRNLDLLTRNKEVLALNNKDLIADIKSLITQLPLNPGTGNTEKNEAVLTSLQKANQTKSDSEFQLDPKMLGRIKELAAKYPQLADKLNSVISKTAADMHAIIKSVQNNETKLADISLLIPKPVIDSFSAEKPAQSSQSGAVDQLDTKDKKTVLSSAVGMSQFRKADSTELEQPLFKKLTSKPEEIPVQSKTAINTLAVPANQNNLNLRVSAPVNTDILTFRQNILDQVDNAVKLQINGPQNEVRIKLNPASLGEIIIKLQIMEDKTQPGKQVLVSNMLVENESVKDALLSGVAQLKQSMQDNSGVNLKDFNVMVKTNQEFNPQQRQSDNYRASKKKGFFDETEDDELQDESLSEVMMDLDGIFDYVA